MVSRMMDQALRVIDCPAELRETALRTLHAGYPADQQAAFALILGGLDPADQTAWDGLFIAAPSEQAAAGIPVGAAVWVQQTAGNTSVVWPPAAGTVAVEPLLRAAAEFVDQRGMHLAQIQLAADHDYSPDTLRRAGFGQLAELVYMAAEVASPATVSYSTANGLQFVPRAMELADRLATVVERTYEQTRDCPALENIRPISEVLAGYRAQGEYLPDQWHLVIADGCDVGAVILASHSTVRNWELVYMGVAPEARGRGFGEQIVRFALRAAAAGGAERLVLAVDAANEPALRVYRRTGFREWDRRIVYARLRSHS
jgi:mycothiol synthase